MVYFRSTMITDRSAVRAAAWRFVDPLVGPIGAARLALGLRWMDRVVIFPRSGEARFDQGSVRNRDRVESRACLA
jgi:hypothetical protein